MNRPRSKLEALSATVRLAGATVACVAFFASGPAAGSAAIQQRSTPPPSAQLRTPAGFDLTGYWVSVVTQNWLFRMVVPGPGEYRGIPLNLRAKQFADAWRAAPDVAAGKQCEAYGAPAIMRIPENLHITWANGDTLEVQTDAGMQTRLLRFRSASTAREPAPSRQGLSIASWVLHVPPRRFGPAPRVAPAQSGSLEVTTDDLLPGLLRKNGVPYSERTTMKEYWEVNTEPDGYQWLTITTELHDPVYLHTRYIFTSIFHKEKDGSRWNPSPCSLRH